MRTGKDDNKVTNLIHLFCSQLAATCTAEEDAVFFVLNGLMAVEICGALEG